MFKFSNKKFYFYLFFVILYILYFCRNFLFNLNYLSAGDWDLIHTLFGAVIKNVVFYHQFPLWNPWECGGNVLLQSIHTPLFHLSYIFTFFINFVAGIKISLLIYFAISYFGFYLLARNIFKIKSIFPIFCIATIFCFNSSNVLKINEGHHFFHSICYIPFIFYFYERYLARRKIIYIALSSLFWSLIVYEGGSYIIFMSFLLILLYSIFNSIFSRKFIYLKALLIFCVLSLFLGAIRILPILEFMYEFPYLRYEGTENIPLKSLWRYMTYEKVTHGGAWGWHERSMYVGYTTIFLTITAMITLIIRSFKIKRAYRIFTLLLMSVFFFLMVIGGYSENSLYSMLNKLPVFRSIHVTGRYFYPFLFSVCYILLLFFKEIENIFGQLNFKSKKTMFLGYSIKFVLIYFIPLFIIYDLSHIHQKPFSKIGSLPITWNTDITKIDPSRLSKYSMVQRRASYGSISSMFPGVLDNRASLVCYDGFNTGQNAKINKPLIYIQKGKGTITDIQFTPNKYTFSGIFETPVTVTLNQNYTRAWNSSDPQYKVINLNQNPSIELPSGQYENLSFYFWPKTLFLSFFLSFIGIIFLLFLFIKNFKKPTKKISTLQDD